MNNQFDDSDKSGDLEGFVFAAQEKGDFLIGRKYGGESSNLGSFPIYPEDGIGFELIDHMVAALSTKLNQLLRPIPTICEKIDFTRNRESKGLEHPFG